MNEDDKITIEILNHKIEVYEDVCNFCMSSINTLKEKRMRILLRNAKEKSQKTLKEFDKVKGEKK